MTQCCINKFYLKFPNIRNISGCNNFFIITFLIRNYNIIVSFLQDIFLPTLSKGYSDPSQTSRTEFFAATVNGF